MPFLAPIGFAIMSASGVAAATGSAAAGSAILATTIGAAAVGVAGYGAYAAGSAMSRGQESSAPSVAPIPPAPALTPAPTPEAADNSAQAAVEKMRRIRALAGGKTLLTSESPILSGTTGAKTLLGS